MWIEKLNKKELLQMHKFLIMEDTQKIETSKIKQGVAITAYENWPYEDGSPDYVPTEYVYKDYDYIDYDTSDTGHWKTVGEYRQFMTQRFGIEYVKAMVKEMLNVDITAIILRTDNDK
jgi:hypothetical protein